MTPQRLLLLFALAAGCGKNVYFSDDEGATRPSTPPLGDHPDEMSLPYAVGTHVNIGVKQLDATEAAAWTVRSDAPSVLSVDKIDVKDADLTAACTAHAEGDTVLHLVDVKGRDQRKVSVSVRAPNHARLFSHELLRVLGRSESSFDAAEVSELRVLAGGKGVFAVAYFHGAERVFGRGIAESQVASSVTVEDHTTNGVATNEWLFISPSTAGTSSLTLKVAGTEVASLPLVAVTDADVTTLKLVSEATTAKDDKQQIWMVPEASDARGRAVHGVYCSWTLDGTPQTGKDNPKQLTGDLFRFEFDPKGSARTLVATRGGLQATATLHAHDGWVSDTTYLGCSVGSGRARPGPLVALAFLLAVFALRRRLLG